MRDKRSRSDDDATQSDDGRSNASFHLVSAQSLPNARASHSYWLWWVRHSSSLDNADIAREEDERGGDNGDQPCREERGACSYCDRYGSNDRVPDRHQHKGPKCVVGGNAGKFLRGDLLLYRCLPEDSEHFETEAGGKRRADHCTEWERAR